jgi:mono/diheme cytochrome c family protein
LKAALNTGRFPMPPSASHRGRRLYPAATVLVLLIACGRERTPIERGASVVARACAGCHGASGRGGTLPGFAVPPRDLTDPELQDRLSDALIRETIQRGKGQMPNFGKALPPSDVDDVILFIRSIARARPGAPAQPASTTSAPSTTSK